jgi:hypothetical protein
VAAFTINPPYFAFDSAGLDTSTITLKRLAFGATMATSALDALGSNTGHVWYFNGSIWQLALN